MACVINEFGERCWVPGIIQSKLIASKPNIKVFKILYFNGQEGENQESDLVKINKYSYGSIVTFIRSKLGISSNISSFNEKAEISVDISGPLSEDRGTSTRDDDQTKSEEEHSNHIKEAELQEVKSEIVSNIKEYLGSLKLDKKYQKMYDEFSRLRKTHKSINENLTTEISKLKKELDDFKAREPQIIDLNLTELEQKLDRKIREANETNKQLIVHVKDDTLVRASSSTPTKPVVVERKSSTKLRKNLPELKSGEEALVRWSDDGWYYLSVIRENLGNSYYEIEDSLGQIIQVSREDIISREDGANDSFEVNLNN